MTAWNPDTFRIDTARDLREIVRLCDELEEEAIHRANDREMPGGDALVMLGPAANLEAWEHRFETAERTGADTTYASLQEAEMHPLLVLATWEDAIREEREQPTDLTATIPRAADYIAKSVEWLIGVDEDGDANFLGVDALSADLRKCRSALENVLHDGVRAEFAQVKCINDHCDEKPRLMKVYADEAANDHHKCPACRGRYDYDEYVRAAKVHMASERADDTWVTVADAAHSTGRTAKSVRSWIRDEKVSTQKAPGRPSLVYVYWPEVRDADRESRVVEGRRKIKPLRHAMTP